jgi:DNA replication protein DnaC
MYGPKFQLPEEDKPAVLKLLCWFLHDGAVAAEEGINLDKGILLTGPVGCGKTAMMKILCSLCTPDWHFLIKPCPQVALEFAQEGYDVINRYTTRSFCMYNRPRTICFDDLGFERDMPYFGNPCNTMAEILPIRYTLFIDHNMITHATTNLNSAKIEARYGNRIRSRMREMFNFIAFPPDSRDKRV